MFSHLEHRIHAYFTVCEELPYIVISKSLQKDPPLLRCVLAEELGHYYTSAGIGVPIPHVLYSGRIKLRKDEYRAMRWASEYLLPLDKLAASNCSPWELAERFCVTEEMVHFRLKMIQMGVAS